MTRQEKQADRERLFKNCKDLEYEVIMLELRLDESNDRIAELQAENERLHALLKNPIQLN